MIGFCFILLFLSLNSRFCSLILKICEKSSEAQELSFAESAAGNIFHASAKVMSHIVNFFRLSPADRRLAIEAALFLGLARSAVITLPFRRVASFLGRQNNILTTNSEEELSDLRVRRVAWAIRLVSRHTPWCSNCLAKAIAGRLMLRRRSIASTIYFGMAKDDTGEFEAHAWLSSGGTILTGGSDANRFAVVATFAD